MFPSPRVFYEPAGKHTSVLEKVQFTAVKTAESAAQGEKNLQNKTASHQWEGKKCDSACGADSLNSSSV